ncbi:MAG: hypothetical protein FWC27_11090 [Firmicutes bacterium]|nr:hypothetical protein [Bacillota bacterium]
MSKLIIGLTGAFGSGCSFLSRMFLESGALTDKSGGQGAGAHKQIIFKRCKLSDILKQEYEKEKGQKITETTPRSVLQDYGDAYRKDNGADAFAKLLCDALDGTADEYIVIDSIRNPAEIECFRKKWSNFILAAIFADKEIRLKRLQNNGLYKSRDEFERDDKRDEGGKSQPKYGQQVRKCFFEADLVVSNNHSITVPEQNYYQTMRSRLEGYINAFLHPEKAQPSPIEIAMANAYTVGRNSKCMKRMVGAVVVDAEYNLLSSGFNNVPPWSKSCRESLGYCYRDWYREYVRAKRIQNQLDSAYPDNEKNGDVAKAIAKDIKSLELCRAMHAEENAIMNMVGRTASIGLPFERYEIEETANEKPLKRVKEFTQDTILFVTTFPCNLCANKIVKSGIRKVVYFEPYPVDEAKIILEEGHVPFVPFEGVTFRAFFKAYQYGQND